VNEIVKPRIECVATDEFDRYGKFVVEPLERGYGITLGNSLRRILLSSLPGSAALNIKIKGACHEFTTIPGVVEDVTEIILNIKSVAFKIYSNDPETTKIVSISKSEKGEVTAADIVCDSDIEVLNPEQHIATLNFPSSWRSARRPAGGRQIRIKRRICLSASFRSIPFSRRCRRSIITSRIRASET